jgi:hypothetical protein
MSRIFKYYFHELYAWNGLRVNIIQELVFISSSYNV